MQSTTHTWERCVYPWEWWHGICRADPSLQGSIFSNWVNDWVRVNCETYELHDLNFPRQIVFRQAVQLLWSQRNKLVFMGAAPSDNPERSCLERAAEFCAATAVKKISNIQTIWIWRIPPRTGWVKLDADGYVSTTTGDAGSWWSYRRCLRRMGWRVSKISWGGI